MIQINPNRSLKDGITDYLLPILIILLFFDVFSNFFGDLKYYSVFFLFALVFFHCYIIKGFSKSIIFFSITLTFGFLSELIGTVWGAIYGAYYYLPRPPLMIFDSVPIQTPFSWSVIIYTCYCLTNIIVGSYKIKPIEFTKYGKDFTVFLSIVMLSLIDAIAAMNIDMMMDPIAANHSWVWIFGGPYYGVPITNFIGWFSVTFFSTIIFRLFEQSNTKCDTHSKISLLYIPIVIYIFYFLKFSFGALKGNILDPTRLAYPELVLIGFSAMMPFILLSIFSLFFQQHEEK
jgi:uncharacterized membrane protein